MATCYKVKPNIFSYLQDVTHSSDISKAVFTFERGSISTAEITVQSINDFEVENLIKKFDLVEREKSEPINKYSFNVPLISKNVDQKTNEVQLVCGDPQTIQKRINELLPVWQMDGSLVWDGKIFWQKMVKCG